MKAIRFHDYGPSSVLVLEDAPMPVLKPDSVLVEVHAAALNPSDWKYREGLFKQQFPLKLPYIGGQDVAGTVAERGPLAERVPVGTPVYAATFHNGAFAEYVAVPVDDLAEAPRSIPLEHAAAAPIAALTAWCALFDVGRLRSGQRVLVQAGAGGVGTFAVQLAKLAGAHVVATASAGNAEFVRGLGADEAIDYRSVDVADVVRDMDLVLDMFGGEEQRRAVAVLRRGGSLVTLEPPGPDRAQAAEIKEKHGVRAAFSGVRTSGARLAELSAMIDRGAIRVVVDREYPLAEAGAAQDYLQEGHARGKVILRIA